MDDRKPIAVEPKPPSGVAAGVAPVASLLIDEPDPDIVDRLESGARASVDKVAARVTETRSGIGALWLRLVAWLHETLPGVWTRSLWRDWLRFVPVDARDIRRDDFIAILRGLDDGATTFPELEASLARYSFKRPGTPDSRAIHGSKYRRSQFCKFQQSPRLRYAWFLLSELRAVATFGQPEFESELTSIRVQRIANRLVALKTKRWGYLGVVLADGGRQLLTWETSLAKSRMAARLSLPASGPGRAMLADPEFWFKDERLPISSGQLSRLWETWLFFLGAVSGVVWSLVSIILGHDLPRHVRPSMMFFALCCSICATLLAVRVAPLFGSFWSELILLDFRSVPTVEYLQAQFRRRAEQREKRRQASGERVWEFAREAEVERLRRDAPVVVRTDRAAEIVKGSAAGSAVAPPASVVSAVVVPGTTDAVVSVVPAQALTPSLGVRDDLSSEVVAPDGAVSPELKKHHA